MDMYQNINVTALAVYTNNFASHELIDPTGNMTKDRVLILSGMNDSTVLQGRTYLYIIHLLIKGRYNLYVLKHADDCK